MAHGLKSPFCSPISVLCKFKEWSCRKRCHEKSTHSRSCSTSSSQELTPVQAKYELVAPDSGIQVDRWPNFERWEDEDESFKRRSGKGFPACDEDCATTVHTPTSFQGPCHNNETTLAKTTKCNKVGLLSSLRHQWGMACAVNSKEEDHTPILTKDSSGLSDQSHIGCTDLDNPNLPREPLLSSKMETNMLMTPTSGYVNDASPTCSSEFNHSILPPSAAETHNNSSSISSSWYLKLSDLDSPECLMPVFSGNALHPDEHQMSLENRQCNPSTLQHIPVSPDNKGTMLMIPGQCLGMDQDGHEQQKESLPIYETLNNFDTIHKRYDNPMENIPNHHENILHSRNQKNKMQTSSIHEELLGTFPRHHQDQPPIMDQSLPDSVTTPHNVLPKLRMQSPHEDTASPLPQHGPCSCVCQCDDARKGQPLCSQATETHQCLGALQCHSVCHCCHFIEWLLYMSSCHNFCCRCTKMEWHSAMPLACNISLKHKSAKYLHNSFHKQKVLPSCCSACCRPAKAEIHSPMSLKCSISPKDTCSSWFLHNCHQQHQV
ncbi:uncharacterized protein LOC143022153 [Oratosquilla oratoria]|uniref:uncharacterized protein LOC143022153 n=1 Tax=Oratosquilla oratoria TaxID=337810 RepID=UPI003F75EDF8